MPMFDSVFKADVKGDKLFIRDRERFDKNVLQLQGEVEVIVRKPKKPISKQERGYYWAVIIKLVSRETGAMPEDVHHEFKRRFLRIGGSNNFPLIKSTTQLTTAEAEDYYTQCRVFAANELGIIIPLPNEII